MSVPVKPFPHQPEVDYLTECRPQLRTGDILMCSGSGLFSSMIQRGSDSVWSHVGLIVKLEEYNRVMLLESVEPAGVRAVRLSKYLDNYDNRGNPYPGGLIVARHRQFEHLVDETGRQQLVQFALDQFGYPYDKDQIARISARILARAINFSDEEYDRIKPDKEYLCSEYVDRCWRSVGVEVPLHAGGFILPSDFARDDNIELLAVLQAKHE
ncbi:hypothetical protein HMF8227_00525 [Saliniradius amylolyticus]|uniref:Permuted papain-like amidase enzyme, YaeF/YiiX, C92 family n=1 Tax=Saliniradius amylolyticus TaxID=2183582 RepID=A0A2S2E050_9ALTE|nr:YiiX/YebB-like N1pC/P60 family cysteine hydrolase [Saliniradius amylolyticus]AWL11021.1 hypothetical protein HMF8227_00525 [Saliniradius amylolyticus]